MSPGLLKKMTEIVHRGDQQKVITVTRDFCVSCVGESKSPCSLFFCHSGLDPESSPFQRLWTPAFAGVTDSETGMHQGDPGGNALEAASPAQAKPGRVERAVVASQTGGMPGENERKGVPLRGPHTQGIPFSTEEFTRKEKVFPVAPYPRIPVQTIAGVAVSITERLWEK